MAILTYTARVPSMGQMAQIFFKVTQMSHQNLVTIAGDKTLCNVYFLCEIKAVLNCE